jgi:hypothetical protein
MFDQIIQELSEIPGAEYRVGQDLICVLPRTPEGFEVKIEQIWENHFTVSFDGWHEEFFNFKKAVECFLLGLSNRCRLKTEEKGGARFQWTLEYLDGEEWRKKSSTRRLIHPFWKRSVITYLRNDLLCEKRQVQLEEVTELQAQR